MYSVCQVKVGKNPFVIRFQEKCARIPNNRGPYQQIILLLRPNYLIYLVSLLALVMLLKKT